MPRKQSKPKTETTTAIQPATDLLPPDELDALVNEIALLYRASTFDFALRLGRLVVDRMYGGKIENWRDGVNKEATLEQVAKRLEQLHGRVLSVTALQQAIATLDLELRVGVSARPQLSVSHVRAVIGLPDAEQEALLGRAEARNWGVDQLKLEAAKFKKKLSKRKGRKPLPGVVKTVNRWERELADEATHFADIDQIAELDPAERARVKAAVAAMHARCAALLAVLPD